jgi:hypothetical protein
VRGQMLVSDERIEDSWHHEVLKCNVNKC